MIDKVMTELQQKCLMQNIFGMMLVNGDLNNQHRMTSLLKAIYTLLGTQENLTSQEQDNCLLYFFREYAQGCNHPIDDLYIRANMIPIVKRYPNMDLARGLSLLLAAKSHI